MYTFLSSFQHLPIFERLSISIHLALVLLFLFFASVRRIVACVSRIRLIKEDPTNANSIPVGRQTEDATHNVAIGTGFKASVFCCFYVLFLQVLVLGFDGTGLIRNRANGKSKDWSLLYLPAAQALAWFVLSFSAFSCKFKALEKFPFLLRIWWFVSFILCLYSLFVDGQGLWIHGSKFLNSHVVANFAATPALAFLCFIAVGGATGIQINSSKSGKQYGICPEAVH